MFPLYVAVVPGNGEHARQSETRIQESWNRMRCPVCMPRMPHLSRKELIYEGPALALAPEAIAVLGRWLGLCVFESNDQIEDKFKRESRKPENATSKKRE